MSLSREIVKALTREHVHHGPAGFGELIAELEARAGSGRKAAKLAGIPETTWRRLKAGASPRVQATRGPQLSAGYRAATMDKAAAERWRSDGMRITVTEPGNARQTRTLSARNLKLVPGTGDKVVTAYLAGDAEGAADAFKAGIGEGFYRTMMFGAWMEDDTTDYAVSVVSAA